MIRVLHIAALTCIISQSSCARVELDGGEFERSNAEATRLSSPDGIVLCPVSAALGKNGNVAIVWAGYPPGDDQLQLLHTMVSPTGKLVQATRPIAALDSELVALQILQQETGFEVVAVNDNSQSISLEIDASGMLLNVAPATQAAWVADTCEISIETSETRLTIYRGQVDNELPLFVVPGVVPGVVPQGL